MVETNSNQMTIRSAPLTKNLSIPNQAYLTTAMLLGTQNCNYLGQRLNNLREHIADNDLVLNASVQPITQQHGQIQSSPSSLNRTHSDKDNEKTIRDDVKMRDCSTASMPTSTFTIDSILASKPADIKFEYNSKSDSRSPSNSPSLSTTSSPVRPTRVPAMLHPGLHLSHLAAAAATGFGTPSDFLGKWDGLWHFLNFAYSSHFMFSYDMKILGEKIWFPQCFHFSIQLHRFINKIQQSKSLHIQLNYTRLHLDAYANILSVYIWIVQALEIKEFNFSH